MEKVYQVLFLEDEPTIREVLTEYMTISGYEVVGVECGEEAIDELKKKRFDIAILDIMVPGIDGFGVLSYIKEHEIEIATIMLTALEDEKTQVKAFNLYADDYVIKPVSPIILLKRMETILRRVAPKEKVRAEEEAVKKARGFQICEDAYCVYWDGAKLPLTLSEYLLFLTLYKEPKRVFTREQLILRIFNEDYIGNDRIIDAHVKNLRKKLPISCIKTVIGVGYQFEEMAGKEA